MEGVGVKDRDGNQHHSTQGIVGRYVCMYRCVCVCVYDTYVDPAIYHASTLTCSP